ncbi:FAR1-related sequence 5-like protein [Tanacetum coccineum]
MDDTMDLEIHHVEDPFKTSLIGNIDENGCLSNNLSEFEKEEGNSDGIDPEFENYKDIHVMGKVFNTHADAYEFYNRYAFLHGFGIRIYSTYKNKITKEHYRKIYVCNKEGYKYLKSRDVKKHRRDLRTGCTAKIRISLNKEKKWFVDYFDDAHNHELNITHSKVMKHCSHGKFHRSMVCKSLMSELGKSGLKPCQIKKVVNTMKSPYDNVFLAFHLGLLMGRSGTLVRQESACNHDLRIWVCLADFHWPVEVSSGNLSSVLLPLDRSQFGLGLALEVHPVLPNQNDTMHERPVGKIGLYTRFFDYANFRLPLSTFLVDVLRHFHINISQLSVIGAAKNGWMSFSKRSDNAPVCYTKPLDSLNNWNDHFFWVDDFACPASFSWHTAKNVTRDSAPLGTDFNAQDYATLHLFCADMDIFAFIHTPDPTKVKIVERERNEGEPLLLETTVGHTVPLLLVAPDRVVDPTSIDQIP